MTDNDNDLIPGPVDLTPKELDFCERFANPESVTYGRATMSAEAAGYEEPHNAAWKLRRRPRIVAKLREYHDVIKATVGKVITDLEHERLAALAKGDISTAVRASELEGKTLAMFSDVLTMDPSRMAAYDQARREAQDQLYQLMIDQQIDAAPALPAPAATPAATMTLNQATGQFETTHNPPTQEQNHDSSV